MEYIAMLVTAIVGYYIGKHRERNASLIDMAQLVATNRRLLVNMRKEGSSDTEVLDYVIHELLSGEME